MSTSAVIRALDRATDRIPEKKAEKCGGADTKVHRAEDASRRIRRALNLGTGIDHSLRTAIELAQSLQLGVGMFSRNWADQSADEIQALRNMSTSLEAFARQVSDDLAIALGVALEYRSACGSASTHPDPAFDALGEEIFEALQRIGRSAESTPYDDVASGGKSAIGGRLALDPQLAADVAAALEEAVVVNRRTGVYHPRGSIAAGRISVRNQLLYASAEAAELDGFRASRAPDPASSGQSAA